MNNGVTTILLKSEEHSSANCGIISALRRQVFFLCNTTNANGFPCVIGSQRQDVAAKFVTTPGPELLRRSARPSNYGPLI